MSKKSSNIDYQHINDIIYAMCIGETLLEKYGRHFDSFEEDKAKFQKGFEGLLAIRKSLKLPKDPVYSEKQKK